MPVRILDIAGLAAEAVLVRHDVFAKVPNLGKPTDMKCLVGSFDRFEAFPEGRWSLLCAL